MKETILKALGNNGMKQVAIKDESEINLVGICILSKHTESDWIWKAAKATFPKESKNF